MAITLEQYQTWSEQGYSTVPGTNVSLDDAINSFSYVAPSSAEYSAPTYDVNKLTDLVNFGTFIPYGGSYGYYPSAGTSAATDYLTQTYGDPLRQWLSSQVTDPNAGNYFNYYQSPDYFQSGVGGWSTQLPNYDYSGPATITWNPAHLQTALTSIGAMNDPTAQAYMDWFNKASTSAYDRYNQIQDAETDAFYKQMALSVVSAFAAPALSPMLGGLLSPIVGETLAPVLSSALIGGTTSELGGGDFLQGALTSGLTSGITSGLGSALSGATADAPSLYTADYGITPTTTDTGTFGDTTMFDGLGDFGTGDWGSGYFGDFTSTVPTGSTGWETPSLQTADYGLTPTSGTTDWTSLLSSASKLLAPLFTGTSGTGGTTGTTGGTTTGTTGTTSNTGSLAGLISSIYGYDTASDYSDFLTNLINQQADPFKQYRQPSGDLLMKSYTDPLSIYGSEAYQLLDKRMQEQQLAAGSQAGTLYNAPERLAQRQTGFLDYLDKYRQPLMGMSGASTSPAQYGGVQAEIAKSQWPIELAKASAVGGSLSQLPGAISGTTDTIMNLANLINQYGTTGVY